MFLVAVEFCSCSKKTDDVQGEFLKKNGCKYLFDDSARGGNFILSVTTIHGHIEFRQVLPRGK